MEVNVNVILDFLKRNRFLNTEVALLGELNNRPDLNGYTQKSSTLPRGLGNSIGEQKTHQVTSKDQGSSQPNGVNSKELVIKEVEYGNSYNRSNRKKAATNEEKCKNLTFAEDFDDTPTDLYPWNGDGPILNNFSDMHLSKQSKCQLDQNPYVLENMNSIATTWFLGKDYVSKSSFSNERIVEWRGSTSQINDGAEYDREDSDCYEFNSDSMPTNDNTTVQSMDILWAKHEESLQHSMDSWKNCSVKTVLPSPKVDVPPSTKMLHDANYNIIEHLNVTEVVIPEKSIPLIAENQKEDLPKLPPVRLKSDEKLENLNWEGKANDHGLAPSFANADNTFLMNSFLDCSVGNVTVSSGGKRNIGSNWLSVSQGIAEDTSDLVSGFATVRDGLSESIDYPNEYWDSDEYDDDDDVGYMRQPIEDETWFLNHEVDYPSDNERGLSHGNVSDQRDKCLTKDEDDDRSFVEDSYFSGEQFAVLDDSIRHSVAEMYDPTKETYLMTHYNEEIIDNEEPNLLKTEPIWQGFVTRNNELIMARNGKSVNRSVNSFPNNVHFDDQHGSFRSIGVGINNDVAEFGSEFRESMVERGGSLNHSHFESNKNYYDKSDGIDLDKHMTIPETRIFSARSSQVDGDLALPLYFKSRKNVLDEAEKNIWLMKDTAIPENNFGYSSNILLEIDDVSPTDKDKSNEFSQSESCKEENSSNAVKLLDSNNLMMNKDDRGGYEGEEHVAVSLEDEEMVAMEEQVRQIKAQEDEFETFNLKIVHRKIVIAGRYHVTEYLGSAAFSKAIQAHDLHTGTDVCVKIIKNNKDFFDQSLDEIKLLKYVNRNDPGDKYHILRLYDYFYYREHLLIVCELLKANLYEFHKFNRESGGEVYFTMPRLQSITIQCLEALQFLHSLGLIHCDLKPENILIKSYSRCEVKVIDLGSSCFETDHLCSYVQSRSYRAPEVILGLPYDKKIDIWSLGCVLAELCTGNVLFQNDSPATLLARVIGVIGFIDQDMLVKGRETYKYFTKNHMLY